MKNDMKKFFIKSKIFNKRRRKVYIFNFVAENLIISTKNLLGHDRHVSKVTFEILFPWQFTSQRDIALYNPYKIFFFAMMQSQYRGKATKIIVPIKNNWILREICVAHRNIVMSRDEIFYSFRDARVNSNFNNGKQTFVPLYNAIFVS